MALAPALTIELVPSTSWFANAREVLTRDGWDKVRKRVYAEARHRCEICNGVGQAHPVECHEVWRYDDRKHEQHLERMVALCPACHEVKHFGLAETKGRGGIAIVHLARVNGWDRARAEVYVDEAFEVWRDRSMREWRLFVAGLARYGLEGHEYLYEVDSNGRVGAKKTRFDF